MNNYFINPKYKCRKKIKHHVDIYHKDEYQNEVYEMARSYAKDGDRILDIGCGSGFKLIKYFEDFDTTGLELSPTLEWLKENYPEKKWIKSDVGEAPKDSSFDIVICSDIIEHLDDPSILINYINLIDFKYCFISTPERDSLELQRDGRISCSPPRNRSHYREWNFDEFSNYMSSEFNNFKHIISNKEQSTQLVIIEKE